MARRENRGRYVDGFVIVVPRKNVAAYRKMAQLGKKIWMKHGALDYKECMGDDLQPKVMGPMKHRLFPQMAKARSGETVWFSFIVYRSRKHRDAVNAKVMKDPAMSAPQEKNAPMPFDMKRFAYGGFKVLVS